MNKMIMIRKCVWFFMIVYILLIMSIGVIAQPVSKNPHFDEGLTLQIVEPYLYDNINTSHYVHIHVFNTVTGLIVNTSNYDCFYHLYSHNNGREHIITDGTLTPYGTGYQDYINESYFIEEDIFTVLIWCNGDTQGGFTEYSFKTLPQIDSYGEVRLWSCPVTTQSYLIIGLIIGMIIFLYSLSLKSSIFGVFGGFSTIFLYFVIGACSPLLLSPILLTGILLSYYYVVK